ncbi:MAG: DUF2147 domain-containing protein [Flavobacteriaceae bacterium]
MKWTLFSLCFLFLVTAQAQSVEGRWATVDDETGQKKSIVSLAVINGKLQGTIEKLLLPEDQGKLCVNCSGDQKNQPIEGMQIVSDLSLEDNQWSDGTILDPKNGKEYSCIIALEQADKLKVRGYLGFSIIGRTQYWYRLGD